MLSSDVQRTYLHSTTQTSDMLIFTVVAPYER